MKRFLHIVAVVAMCLLAVGCGASAEDKSLGEIQKENQPVPPVKMLTNHLPYFALGENGGYMTINSSDYGYDFYGELIVHIDENTKEMNPLCKVENCAHNTQDCTAFSQGSQGGYSLVCYNGKVYCFVGGNSVASDGHTAKIYSIDENTFEKKLLAEFDYGYSIYTTQPVFVCDNGLYYLASYIAQTEYGAKNMYGIARFDIATGNAEMVYSTEMVIQNLGIDGNMLVFTAAARTSPNSHMYYLDLTAGEAVENTEYDCRYERLWYTPQGMFSLDGTNNVIYRYTDGAKERVSRIVGDYVGYTGLYQRGVYNNILVLDCFKSVKISTDNYDVISTKLAVNLDSGEINEIHLQYEAGGLTEEVRINGVMRDGFVVKCGEEYYQTMETGQDGVIRTAERSTTKLAYITAEDFLSGRANYTPLN